MPLARTASLQKSQPASKSPGQWNVWGQFKSAARPSSGRAALVIGLLIALLWAPQLVRFGEREAPQRTVRAWLPAREGLENLELKLLDARFAARGIVVPPSAAKIAIIGIDQNSLTAVAQWPWPRRLHARLIDRLKKAGARVIVFDLDFSDRQFPTQNSLSADDRALIGAAKRAGNVILPSLLNIGEVGQSGARNLGYQLATPFSADAHGDGLDEQTLDLGLAFLPADGDERYRRYPFAATISGETIGGLAPLACAVYQGLLTPDDNKRYQSALNRGVWPSLNGSQIAVPARAVQFPGLDAPRLETMSLNWAGPGGTFPTYSYADVLNGFDEATLRRDFGGRIVLVGATAVVLKDRFPAPSFSSNSRDIGTDIAGVEIHATAVSMLLDGRYLTPPLAWLSWASLFGLSLFCAGWTERARDRVSRAARRFQAKWSARKWRGRVYDVCWFTLYSVVAALPLLAFWLACVAAFRGAHLWVVAVYPLGAGMMASALTLMYLFTLESSGRRKVVSQLGLYMDKEVVDEILAHPEEEYPRPRRTQATVLFTDIEGFTAFSQARPAEEVVAALNAFFSRMKPIVAAHGGAVDKFVGDAMMCFWGVPIPRADHARRALNCALELQEECARFRLETGIPFRMRVGLHTGELIVGSVGSGGEGGGGAHMNYTVIGDTVNLASRLEAQNKAFGSWILCSRATGEAAPDVAQFEAARAQIPGLRGEVEVLIVSGWRGQRARASVWGARSPAEIERAEVMLASGEQLPELPAAPLELVGGGRVFESE